MINPILGLENKKKERDVDKWKGDRKREGK
jgi:hypothetical protein